MSQSKSARAVLIEDNRLLWSEVPALKPEIGEVLIDNKASAVNRADLVQRQGSYPPPPGASEILGLECAGIVKSVGEGVTRCSVGDRVCALLSGGGYATEVVAPAGQVLPIPKGFSFTQAAALPEVFATAWLNLFMEARLQSGEYVLLHAGASGVGSAAIQLCRAFDVQAFVTVGNQSKLEFCIQLGAVNGIDRHKGKFVEQAQAWTQGKGFDVILDPVGGNYLKDNLRSLATDGRLVVIGLMGGATAEIPLAGMMVKRQRIIGSTLRARSIASKSMVMDSLKRNVWPLLEAGTVKPVIDKVIAIQEVEKAHSLVESNQTIGKVVLAIDGES